MKTGVKLCQGNGLKAVHNFHMLRVRIGHWSIGVAAVKLGCLLCILIRLRADVPETDFGDMIHMRLRKRKILLTLLIRLCTFYSIETERG
jgi:hypothetical protein